MLIVSVFTVHISSFCIIDLDEFKTQYPATKPANEKMDSHCLEHPHAGTLLET